MDFCRHTAIMEKWRDLLACGSVISSRRVGDRKEGEDMTRVLLIGLLPEADPAPPPGMNATTIRAGIELSLKQMTDRGWEADTCLIRPDAATAGPTVAQKLATTTYDCIVIGGGVRLPPQNLLLFETVVNAVKKAA